MIVPVELKLLEIEAPVRGRAFSTGLLPASFAQLSCTSLSSTLQRPSPAHFDTLTHQLLVTHDQQ